MTEEKLEWQRSASTIRRRSRNHLRSGRAPSSASLASSCRSSRYEIPVGATTELAPREEMKASASVASDYQGALVLWTIILSITTVAYAVAAFLPFIRPPEREWVLWGRDRDNVWTPRDAFSGSSQCRQGLLDMDIEQTRKIRELRRPDLARQDYFECWPHTVDPRGPKAETK